MTDMNDPEAVNIEFDRIMHVNGYVAESTARRREIARFTGLARRLREGEITEEEFRAALRRPESGANRPGDHLA